MSLNQNLQNYLNINNSTLDEYVISTFYKFLVLENEILSIEPFD